MKCYIHALRLPLFSSTLKLFYMRQCNKVLHSCIEATWQSIAKFFHPDGFLVRICDCFDCVRNNYALTYHDMGTLVSRHIGSVGKRKKVLSSASISRRHHPSK